MDDVLDEVVSPDDLKKFEIKYNQELKLSSVTQQVQFEYSWCLVRSKYPADIRKGIYLLEDLCKNHAATKRDCIYYLAIGNARIKEYNKALKYVKAFLDIEPGNLQLQQLEKSIKQRMRKEGRKGLAVASGVGLAVGLAGVVIIKALTRS
ncbi:hypothetical protein HCN44_007309 [Aphidius gifuensis]|uniref:Mitochondrial fission 1 protein n=1 Tax=Aphidius gifuensis TaxID=684658 RepID=A0A835CN05_APHGI|nr:mitochondrial fission 1 protein-like [Aphidius gifuensis]KAF7988999.1 hypothetical protein HCN44_007309 [Aphidius gifuensis]